MSNDDQKLRELESALSELIELHGEALDEDSITEVLDGVAQKVRRQKRGPRKPPPAPPAPGDDLGFDSETFLGRAPDSEAGHGEPEESPTVEVHVGEAPDNHMPEAGVVMPTRRRARAGTYPAQPPPLPAGRPAHGPRRLARSAVGDLRPPNAQPTRAWKLSDTALSSVLLELVARPGAAVVDLQTGKNRAQLAICDGRLFAVRLLPCSTKRTLTAMLERNGRLNAGQARRLRKHARRNELTEAQALLQAANLLSPAEIRKAVCSRMRHLLDRLMDANIARAELFELDALPGPLELASLSLARVIFERVRDHHSGSFRRPRQQAEARYRDMNVARKANLAFSLNHLGLALHERQLVDRVLARPRSFDRVVRNSPLPREATVAILAGLEAVGLLEVCPPGLGGPATSSMGAQARLSVEQLDWVERRLDSENHFDMLGIHWSAYDAEVVRAFDALSAHFDAVNQPLGLTAQARRRLERIEARLQKLFSVLEAPERRHNYRCTLVPASQRRRAARKLEALGGAALRRKALHSALDYYQRLLELEPTNRKASRLLPVLLARTHGG